MKWNGREKPGTLFAIAVVMACCFAITGCRQYAKSAELAARAETSGEAVARAEESEEAASRAETSGKAAFQAGESGEAAEESGKAASQAEASGEAASQAGESGEAGLRAGEGRGKAAGHEAETVRRDAELTTAAMPGFKDSAADVYVKTSDGSSVRIRSSCDTGNDANIVTYASPGTKLKRTGESSQWTRIEYKGAPAYIFTSYVSAQAPETESGPACACLDSGEVLLNPDWKYADLSKINSGSAMLYRTKAEKRKDIIVCVNAGHGTKGGSAVKTQCHPDGTPKVTGGTTGSGAITAVAVSSGMTFKDGTPESKATLALARILKDRLLDAGYDVLMIRETDDVQLDNIARTVIANNTSDCHIALHWDSTENGKGAFFMGVPDVASYRSMEPVKSHWKQHNALGESLISGLKGAGVKIFSKGSMAMDLTQTSYSTVPSVDIELGDKTSDHSQAALNTLADGLVAGINQYFGQ